MNSPIIQLLVLAAIAVFLILRLRGVLGTREGFEKPPIAAPSTAKRRRTDFEVIDGGPDHDIIDNVPEGSPSADALMDMKRIDNAFHVGEFLGGAKGAYEMILMAFETGDLSSVTPFISEDVFEAFSSVIDEREAKVGTKKKAPAKKKAAPKKDAITVDVIAKRFGEPATHVVAIGGLRVRCGGIVAGGERFPIGGTSTTVACQQDGRNDGFADLGVGAGDKEHALENGQRGTFGGRGISHGVP